MIPVDIDPTIRVAIIELATLQGTITMLVTSDGRFIHVGARAEAEAMIKRERLVLVPAEHSSSAEVLGK